MAAQGQGRRSRTWASASASPQKADHPPLQINHLFSANCGPAAFADTPARERKARRPRFTMAWVRSDEPVRRNRATMTLQLRKKEGEAGTGSYVEPPAPVGICLALRNRGRRFHETVLYPTMEVHR